jgi:hypothetical protein
VSGVQFPASPPLEYTKAAILKGCSLFFLYDCAWGVDRYIFENFDRLGAVTCNLTENENRQ